MVNKILKLIKKPQNIIGALGGRNFFNWLSDETFIKIQYHAMTGKKLNLSSPQTFNEKLQWLKLYGNLQKYTHLVDKYEVRKYIAETIGEEYLIPLIGVWDSFDDIDFDKLPDQFVLKCTHDSGSIVVCTDKATFNIKGARKKLNTWLKRNFYYTSREIQYKNIKPRIICEKYMVDESGIELKDYKIYCFNGTPKIIHVDFDRFTSHSRNFYDTEWNLTYGRIKYPNAPQKMRDKPNGLEDMLNLAKLLTKDYPFVRIDFYLIYNRIYFGELTFIPGSGYVKFEPEEFALKMGSWIELPDKCEATY